MQAPSPTTQSRQGRVYHQGASLVYHPPQACISSRRKPCISSAKGGISSISQKLYNSLELQTKKGKHTRRKSVCLLFFVYRNQSFPFRIHFPFLGCIFPFGPRSLLGLYVSFFGLTLPFGVVCLLFGFNTPFQNVCSFSDTLLPL